MQSKMLKQSKVLVSIHAIKLGLNLVLNGIRVRAVIASHPLELVANIIGNSRVDLCLFLQLLLAQPADRIGTAQVKVIVVFICVGIVAIGRSAAAKSEVTVR
jgi:hypothetical protein